MPMQLQQIIMNSKGLSKSFKHKSVWYILLEISQHPDLENFLENIHSCYLLQKNLMGTTN